MKLKFKQNIHLISENKMAVPGEVIDITDKRQAESLIEANFAEKFVEEKPTTPSKKDTKSAKVVDKASDK